MPCPTWYGIHGVEALFTVMGTGCKQVTRYYTEATDIVVGEWNDNRLGTFRGTRAGQGGLGGTAFCEKGIAAIGPWESYRPLVVKIAQFFRTRQSPVPAAATNQLVLCNQYRGSSTGSNNQGTEEIITRRRSFLLLQNNRTPLTAK